MSNRTSYFEGKKITGRWLCIWPDGQRSIAFDCWSVEEALEALDESGQAEPHMLHVIDGSPCVLDLKREKDPDDGGDLGYMPVFLYGRAALDVDEEFINRPESAVEPISETALVISEVMAMSQTLANHHVRKSKHTN